MGSKPTVPVAVSVMLIGLMGAPTALGRTDTGGLLAETVASTISALGGTRIGVTTEAEV